jgi:peptidyl-tRNA hydrolase, PTH1 family
MKIIVGLGNPGFRYRNTRHNAGFMAVKALSKKYGIALRHRGFHGVYGVGRVLGQEVMLFEPRTYMNLSGEAVGAVCSSKLQEKKDLLVIVDDISLPFGSVRLRENGSAGGHNGLKSIIEFLGQDFARLRMGIRTDEEPTGDLAGFVLSPFRRKDREGLEDMIERAAECTGIWASDGASKAMERHNG